MSTKVNLFQLLKSTKKDTVKRTADRGTVIQTQTSEMQASEKLPTYEEIPKASKKNVMGKLEKEIKEAKKPEDLSCPPTFNRIGYCRQGLCLDTLRESAKKVGAQLENAGYDKLAIFLYWCFFWYRVQPKGSESRIKELIEIDIEGRWISQRRAFIQQRVQALQISSEPLYLPRMKPNMRHNWRFAKNSSRTSIKGIGLFPGRSGPERALYRAGRSSQHTMDKERVRAGISLSCCAMIVQDEAAVADGVVAAVEDHGRCCLKAHGIEDLDVGVNGDIPDLQELCFEYTKPSLMGYHS
ncbi:hypothetical protein N7455_002930 [Penicillium solitum]|uniref:uncharacterized protein n=1 Tax=Penicillium solitum TaxID=60172 RepID=UPI0032C40A76|nr:hypothetical protein N7455_002930 [Penicillium solitum]